VNESINNWAEARLTQTLGGQTAATTTMEGVLGSGTVRPIFEVNMPTISPSPTVDAMDLAFYCGDECQKRASETVVPVGTKYTDNQLVHLMAFCSLDATEKKLVSEIWTNIQCTKGWHDASIELIKWFNTHTRKSIIQYSSIRNW